MRIVVPVSFFPSEEVPHVPRFVLEQLQALVGSEPSFRISVLCPHYKTTQSHIVHGSFDEYRYHYFWPYSLEGLTGQGIVPSLQAQPWRLLQLPFLFTAQVSALWRLTKQLRPDLIYAHWFTPQGVCAWIVSRLSGVPFCVTTHAADLSVWEKIPVLGRWILRKGLRAANGISVVSNERKEYLRSLFSIKEWESIEAKTRVLSMGVALEEFAVVRASHSELRAAHHIPLDAFVLLFLGRLAEKKGVRYLLEAAALLKVQGFPVLVCVGGEGHLHEELSQQAQSLGLISEVRFLGYLTGSTKRDYIHLCDALVVPSVVTRSNDYEGLPVVLLEGLAAGAVVAASATSGARDVLKDGENGFAFRERDAAHLAEVLIRVYMMEGSKKDEIRRRAKETSSQYSWSFLAPKFIALLRESARRRSQAAP